MYGALFKVIGKLPIFGGIEPKCYGFSRIFKRKTKIIYRKKIRWTLLNLGD
jgi:hypothetical protein